jgi:hypothetical protein
LITIALSIGFTIKHRLFARKERLAKRNKATLISLWSQGTAISADRGREFYYKIDAACCAMTDLSKQTIHF